MKGAKLLLALVLLPKLAWGALAIDSTSGAFSCDGSTVVSGTPTCTNTSNQTLTFSFTNTAGTVLYCGVEDGGTNSASLGVTYNGVSLTNVKVQTWNASAQVDIFRLLSPATGANNVVVTLTGVNTTFLAVGCITLTGNNTTTPEAQTASAKQDVSTTTPATVSLAGVTSGNILYGVFGCGAASGFTTPVNPVTSLWVSNHNGNTAGNNAASGDVSGRSGTVAFGYNLSAADFWGVAVVEVAAAGGAPAAPPQRTITGVGQ